MAGGKAGARRLYRDELDELGRGRLQRRRREQRSRRFNQPVFRQRRAFQCRGGDGVPDRFGRIQRCRGELPPERVVYSNTGPVTGNHRAAGESGRFV